MGRKVNVLRWESYLGGSKVHIISISLHVSQVLMKEHGKTFHGINNKVKRSKQNSPHGLAMFKEGHSESTS